MSDQSKMTPETTDDQGYTTVEIPTSLVEQVMTYISELNQGQDTVEGYMLPRIGGIGGTTYPGEVVFDPLDPNTYIGSKQKGDMPTDIS